MHLNDKAITQMESFPKKEISTVNKMKKAATATATATDAECVICCEPFNRSSRLAITCERAGCLNITCMACVRAYLLTSTNEPHCMACKQPWTPLFMLGLTKKWLAETYKPHRKQFLCDIELSKLPETMEAAERFKEGMKEEDKRKELESKNADLRREIEENYQEMVLSRQRQRTLQSGKAPETAEKKVFFMACPAADCNGMLSSRYKCGICENYTCQDCHELKGKAGGEGGEGALAEHVCNADNIASAQAIKKETKQCPGCHIRIYRIEGCSQMWCTDCHTTFDWNTGHKVVTGPLHNPHWLEYQRKTGGGQAPRAPGDVPCGGLCSRYDLGRITKQFRHRTDITVIHNFVGDVTNNRVRIAREVCHGLQDFQKERIKYIVGEWTKEELADHIFKTDRNRQKNTELLHIWELLSAVGIDMFNRMLGADTATLPSLAEDQLKQYNALRIHSNELFATISNTYGQSAPQVSGVWNIEMEKFTSASLARLINTGSSIKHASVSADVAFLSCTGTGTVTGTGTGTGNAIIIS